MNFGLQQCFVLHSAKKIMHKCFSFLKTIAGTTRQNDDVRLMQRGPDGRIVELANLVR